MHLFVDKLTNVDFSYLHPKRGLVGETWLASIVLEGALDQQGMVCDFGIVKKTLRNWLDDTIDHCLLVPKKSFNLKQLAHSESTSLCWQIDDQHNSAIECSSPAQAITLIDSSTITPESVASWCVEQLRELLPDTIDQITLSFEPEDITHHSYHYSHGLKKHDGNCQRIAHGHRSTIEIYRNGLRNSELENLWCEKWRDIYIGSEEDLIESSLSVNQEYYHFAYQSQQGQFILKLPSAYCYLIDTDTTVEFIASHIANELKKQDPSNSFKVKAFEGIGKGAIVIL